MTRGISFLLAICVVACSDGQPRKVAGIEPAGSEAAQKIDSILPLEEGLTRFLADQPRVGALTNGAHSRSELIERFFGALAKSDTTALAQMLVSKSEYGYLYYPTSIYSRKPYELAPDIAWMLNSENNIKAMHRLLGRLGGTRLVVSRTDCRTGTTSGANRLASDCEVAYRTPEGTVLRRKLFNSIIERDGRWKFLSYAGDF